ncbi:hypothetical protein CIK52_15805 [Kocuria rosea]|uniref:hypothetical protein n=1 Tax=Kocuria rosea TaxID=1275 RepID=UPI000D646FF5|nr:hypothetical protein [Kocuria rosea]PWF82721.1 hypothetical protein CIK52_15805 [Kocuria rosea]QCY32961.1 hypothetical protein EQG70_08820 [Kocuria rosea]
MKSWQHQNKETGVVHFPDRDDDNFLRHSMTHLDGSVEAAQVMGLRLEPRTGVFTRHEPMERKY